MSRLEVPLIERKLQSTGDMLLRAELGLEIKSDQGVWKNLIKGDEVAGFFESRDDALAAGYARFGVVPLFVTEVSPFEPIYNIPGALI
jgi:hypothetical protein